MYSTHCSIRYSLINHLFINTTNTSKLDEYVGSRAPSHTLDGSVA